MYGEPVHTIIVTCCREWRQRLSPPRSCTRAKLAPVLTHEAANWHMMMHLGHLLNTVTRHMDALPAKVNALGIRGVHLRQFFQYELMRQRCPKMRRLDDRNATCYI